MLAGKLQQRIPLFVVDRPPSGVRGEVVEDGRGVLVHQGLQLVHLRNELVLEAARVVDWRAAHQGRIRAVQREVWLGKKDLLSRVEQGQKEVHQRVCARHGDADVVRGQPGRIRLPSFGNGITQRRKPGCGGVLVPTVKHGLMEGLNGHGRGLEIRFTKTERNGVLACQIEHLAHPRGLNRPGPCCIRPHTSPTPCSLFKAWGAAKPKQHRPQQGREGLRSFWGRRPRSGASVLRCGFEARRRWSGPPRGPRPPRP